MTRRTLLKTIAIGVRMAAPGRQTELNSECRRSQRARSGEKIMQRKLVRYQGSREGNLIKYQGWEKEKLDWISRWGVQIPNQLVYLDSLLKLE